MGLEEVLRDFLELPLLLRLRSFLASFSCAINSLINAPLSITCCCWNIVIDGERLAPVLGVAGGVQSASASSKTHGKRSSSEMNEVAWVSTPEAQLESELREERRGHEG